MKSVDEHGKTDIKSLSFDELSEAVISAGEPRYRAGQIYKWLHVKFASSFSEMTNLPLRLRILLDDKFFVTVLTPLRTEVSELDGTVKYLFRLPDGNCVESVLMHYHHGDSVCISSQVGCHMGCRFCASTIGGLIRNLTPAEMLDQVYRISIQNGGRISNVVVMGTGEPLDNYESLVSFIRGLSDEHGLHISQRNITVSTCGIVPNMRKLASEGLAVTLALSLHASNQVKRSSLMPVALRYPLDEVMDACDYYFKETGRRITFEYALISGVNDTDQDAAELTALLKGRNCHMNLIPVNPVRERNFVRPDREAAFAFQHRLERGGINATIRREMGRDIDGACGQLRRRFEEG